MSRIPYWKYLIGLGIMIVLLSILSVVKLNNFSIRRIDRVMDADIREEERLILENDNDLKMTIYARYPQFGKLDNAQVQNEINKLIKDLIESRINNFKTQLPVTNNNSPYLKSSLEISYKTYQANNSIISVAFGVSRFFKSHKSLENFVFNYDILKKRQISLEDLFKPDSDFRSFLAKLFTSEQKAQMKDLYGESNLEGSLKLFTLDANNLFLIFNLNNESFYEVKVPYTKINNILISPSAYMQGG